MATLERLSIEAERMIRPLLEEKDGSLLKVAFKAARAQPNECIRKMASIIEWDEKFP